LPSRRGPCGPVDLPISPSLALLGVREPHPPLPTCASRFGFRRANMRFRSAAPGHRPLRSPECSPKKNHPSLPPADPRWATPKNLAEAPCKATLRRQLPVFYRFIFLTIRVGLRVGFSRRNHVFMILIDLPVLPCFGRHTGRASQTGIAVKTPRRSGNSGAHGSILP